MKRVKQFLLVITGVSLFFITGCTTTQNIPYDDVYYSTAKGSPQYLVAQNSNTTATEPSYYKVEKVEAVNTSGQNTKSTVNQNQEGYQVDTIRTNNIDSLTYSNINTGLGFDNPNFGTGIYSWSMGGGGIYGFNNFWYDPYWSNFYYPYSYPFYSWNYPYYYGYGGWGLYSYGYPYWGYGFNNPYYGYYGYYGYGYPYTYFSPYHNWHRNQYYGHREGASLRGSYIPLSGSTVPSVRTKLTRSGSIPSRTLKSTSTSVRTDRSMQYQKAQNNVKSTRVENAGVQHMLRKPPVYRPNNGTTPQRQNQERSVYRRPSNMTTPRYQKPKQYQSLDTRQARSSTEYFRPQPQTIINGKATQVNTRRATQRFNIYRPNNTQSNYRRPVYRNSWIRTNRSTPVRHLNNRPPQRFNSSPQFNRSSQNNTRSFNPPARINNGSGNSSGGNSGGGNSRGSGGGNIRR